MRNIGRPTIISQLFLAFLLLLAVPSPSQTASAKFDRGLFIQIADEMFVGMDRAYERIDPGGCAGARLGKADVVEFRVASGRMARFFPLETRKLDPAAEALLGAILQGEMKIELFCANVAVGKLAEAVEALKAYGDLSVKALRLFQTYYRDRD